MLDFDKVLYYGSNILFGRIEKRKVHVMGELSAFGKIFIGLGILMIIVGGLFVLGGKIPFLGRLPGDIAIQRKNFSFYFPITTCIIISIIFSLVMWLLRRR
ncbi:MAG: DUF2905 domain-containing protein [Candidatus Brocadia sapporoensis]